MDCSPLAMAFKDVDMKLIPLPPPGTEYERLRSPPPSDHSSQEDQDDKKQDSEKKKIQMSREEYLQNRNMTVAEYLKKLREHPQQSYEADLAKFRKLMEGRLRVLKGNVVAKPEVMKKRVDDELSCDSDTSRETNDSFPRNIEGLRQHDFQVKCYQSIVDHRKQQVKKDNGTLVNGVIFSHANFQMILEAEWSLVKMKRLEQILEGVALGCTVDPKWMKFENELQKYYGPMDTESSHFGTMLTEFKTQRWEMIAQMFEEETKMLEKMRKQKKAPSEFPQQLAALREARSRLERKISAMSEFRCDQNPYTNPDGMDFWVVPRPKRTIDVYTIRNEETDKFLENNLPLDGRGVPKVESKDQNQLFVRKGYNAAVFDVGWHYSRTKAFWDIPRQCFLNDHSDKCSHGLDEDKWKSRLLELRGELMKFNPFGVENIVFYWNVYNKCWRLEDGYILGHWLDESGGNSLVDLSFSQRLLNNGGGESKCILFDNHLEGVIVAPVEILLRVWARIEFLIGEQPNHLLPLDDFEKIYENCFGQKFFPLKWGFKDVEDFFENVHKYLPKEVTEDVIIVERDENELDKVDVDAGKQAEIDAKWAEILENGDDDDDAAFDGFDDGDIFEELVHEGPWIQEGEVYRVLNH